MSHSDCFSLLTANSLRLLSALLLAAFWPFFSVRAQCSLICNDGLQISLDPNGQALITTQLIAPNAPISCPGTLQLRLFTPQGTVVPNNVLNCSHVGQTITAEVKHLASGNTCSSTLEVRDALPPTVVCGDKFIFCNHDASPASVPQPPMTDNCTPPDALTVSYFDNNVSLPCGTVQNGVQVIGRIDRTWYVSDESGNETQCVQRIWLKHITLANVTFPPNFDGVSQPSLNCDQNPNDFSITGQPNVEGVPIDNSPDCEFGITHSDQIVNICPPAGYLVLRTWTAIDFCLGSITERTQIIRKEDKTPPTMAPLEDITVGTDGFLCTGTVMLPPAQTSDDCSAVTVTPLWSHGTGFGPFMGVAEGTHVVTYTAKDACGNSTTATMRVTIVDASPPLATCVANLQVSLTAFGIGYVNAPAISAGSFDNCSPITYSVSRDDTLFAPNVQVTCADIGAPIPLILKVTDAAGLENFCEAQVTVRDFLKPTLQCPADVTLNCLQDHTDLLLTGEATASDNCALQSLDFSDIENINPCNIGTVTRVWNAADEAGNTKNCFQQIKLEAVSNISVAFPPNVTVGSCADPAATLPPATGQPVTTGQHCTPLSVTYDDQIFNTTLPPACFRIFRTWKVIDFCIYDPNNDSIGVWEQIQIIDIVDDAPPVLLLPPDLTVGADQPGCQAVVTLVEATAVDCGGPLTVSNNSIYATSIGADASGLYPLGTHTVVFTATDDCGNIAQQALTITVQDLMPPDAVCKNDVSVSLDSAGAATLNATLLDGGSSDNCSFASDLSFSIMPSYFECQDTGSQQITLTVTDTAGNSATCTTNVTISDPTGACLPPPPVVFSIEGTIRTEMGATVAEIPLALVGDGFNANSDCDADGHYFFDEVPGNNIYTLTPRSNANWLNGVSTLDLVLISRHILGLAPLNSPFKIIAADANHSGTVTSLDIVQLRKLILGLSDTVPGSTSWRFVDATHTFSNPQSPFSATLPEKMVYNTLHSNKTDQDFVGIKLGDVNNTTNTADPRSPKDTLYIKAPNLPLEENQAAAVPFYLKDWQTLEGFQFELSVDTSIASLLKVKSARPEILGEAHFAARSNGVFAVSWDNAANGSAMGNDSLLCTLYLLPKQNTDTRMAIKMRTNRLLPEAYQSDNTSIAAIDVRFFTPAVVKDATFALSPARPNPFRHESAIPFFLPEAAELILEVADVVGRIVLIQKTSFPAGHNEWRISARELPSTGVYTYRVQATNFQSAAGLFILGE